MQFFTYPIRQLPSLVDYLYLTLEAPPLTIADKDFGLFLIDATWHYAKRMEEQIPANLLGIRRSLPLDIQTAYPRRQTGCDDPTRGLASVEALSVAYEILGRDGKELLCDYHWKKNFLQKNSWFFAP